MLWLLREHVIGVIRMSEDAWPSGRWTVSNAECIQPLFLVLFYCAPRQPRKQSATRDRETETETAFFPRLQPLLLF
jgi:hypothetical protein